MLRLTDVDMGLIIIITIGWSGDIQSAGEINLDAGRPHPDKTEKSLIHSVKKLTPGPGGLDQCLRALATEEWEPPNERCCPFRSLR